VRSSPRGSGSWRTGNWKWGSLLVSPLMHSLNQRR